MPVAPVRFDTNLPELEARLERVAEVPLTPEECQTLKGVVHTLADVLRLLDAQGTTIARLRAFLGRPSTEKTRHVLQQAGIARPAGPDTTAPDPMAARARHGHGRLGAAAYTGAAQVQLPHPTLTLGARCPACGKGKLARHAPAVWVHVVGQAPLGATVYDRDTLTCPLCDAVFPAPLPAGVGPAKYDASAVSMLALLAYGSGVPFNRLAHLQRAVGIPLPAATQYELVHQAAAALQPVQDALIWHAAQAPVVQNDDTNGKILVLPPPAEASAKERTGVFTSGIVAASAGHYIALFFTGRKHAGENLATVLAQRAAALGPPIQVCDAAARNLPKPLPVLLGNCWAHGRRRFVEVLPMFPAEGQHILEAIGAVYHHDALAQAQALSPEDRLRFHQRHSGPVMTALHDWLTARLAEQQVEPNSGLGRAITYLLTHWEPLTLFLRVPGAPLDNNVCERALKLAIRRRKNSLFYRTPAGARVGDLFMSLIHTAVLCGVNPLRYLTALLRNTAAVAANPDAWLPWTYRDTLAQAAPTGTPP